MKKILLATTLLAGTAGFAAAEVSFSGSANAGIASDAGGDFDVYSSAGLDVTFSGSTDNGLEFGATFDVSVGHSYTFADDDGFSDGDGVFGASEVYISGSFGRVAFQHNGYGFFHNDDSDADQADVDYSGTFGGLTVGVRADVQDVNDLQDLDGIDQGLDGDFADDSGNANDLSASLGYTIAGIALTANVDGTDDFVWDVGAAYTMGAFTAGVTYNVDSVAELTGTYEANGIMATASYNTDSEWSVGGSYTNNGISLAASTDDGNAWEVTGGYDLGGGLSLEAGYNYTKDAFIGAAMTF